MERTITKIEQGKRHPERFNIFLDGEFALSVHEDVLVKCRLHKGQTVHEDDWRGVLKEEEEAKAKQLALKYVAYKPRTEQEIVRYLREKGFSNAIVATVIAWLTQYRYLDDRAYAKAWVGERRRTKGASRELLRMELRQKGIAEQTIDEALADLSATEEADLAREWAFKRYARVRHLDWQTVQRRIGSFLARKGYSYSDIASALADLRRAHDEDGSDGNE